MFAHGISGMYRRVSDTAEYGGYSRGTRVITKATRKEMKKMLGEIVSGKFAKEWMAENKKGRPEFKKMREACDKHGIETVGTKLRGMMEFINKK
jgi:ketol-acid reductoisomerase